MIARFLLSISRHPVGLVGVAVTTASAILILTLFSLQLLGMQGGPYVGILAYLILPLIFVAGLILIPIGLRLERQRAERAAAEGKEATGFPIIDLNRDRTRRALLVVLVMTVLNLVILALATYKGVHTLESTEFCGTACHSVMSPEYTAYQRSPHSRVGCVECHIGPGAGWFVKSKLSGAWQVVSATFDLYPRPIPTPVDNLRPSRETCEQCHWPAKFVGDRLKVIHKHETDEANTPLTTVLLMRVGGVRTTGSNGIHWHVDPSIAIRYRSDPSRETIYDVEMTDSEGNVKTFETEAEPEGELAEWRQMDCVDCHNRPTHVYRAPEVEVDLAMYTGRIAEDLPFLRREAVAALETEYAGHDEARAGIAGRIEAFYAESYPEIASERSAEIREAGTVLGELYASNVFPQMNVTWGTYPEHVGHERSPGCFRCHDEEHTTADGESISQDCDTCHSILAWDEEDPEVLAALGF
jgi:nitrate/TMAO reductase-like tetraheme cytochrome c subunit